MGLKKMEDKGISENEVFKSLKNFKKQDMTYRSGKILNLCVHVHMK